jgi:uncharacterized protein (TIGR03067 family)
MGTIIGSGVATAQSRGCAEWLPVPTDEVQPMASTNETDPPKDDRELLQGTWKGVSAQINSKALPAETAKQLTLVLTAAGYTTKRGDQVLFEGKYTLDIAAMPRAMDILTKDEDASLTAKAIYALEGDTLKLCYGAAGKERPRKFGGEAGSGVTWVVWKRVTP